MSISNVMSVRTAARFYSITDRAVWRKPLNIIRTMDIKTIVKIMYYQIMWVCSPIHNSVGCFYLLMPLLVPQAPEDDLKGFSFTAPLQGACDIQGMSYKRGTGVLFCWCQYQQHTV